jgi:hypothetical protein
MAAIVFCSRCGERLASDDRVCRACGNAVRTVRQSARAITYKRAKTGVPWWVIPLAILALFIWFAMFAGQAGGKRAASTAAVTEETKAEAVELLGQAVYKGEEGELGLALELTKQALSKWPDYSDAKQFSAELAASATAQAGPRLGRPISSGNWEYVVSDVKTAQTLGSTFLRENAKGQYIIVGIILKNIGRENFGISAHDFDLYDGKGIKYSNAVVLSDDWAKASGYNGGVLNISTGNMPPGVPVKYALVFDVAPGSVGLRLRLNQAKVDVLLV